MRLGAPAASAPRELSAPRGDGEDGDGACESSASSASARSVVHGSAAARATRYGKTPLATLDAPRDARLTAGCARRFFFTPGPVSSPSPGVGGVDLADLGEIPLGKGGQGTIQ